MMEAVAVSVALWVRLAWAVAFGPAAPAWPPELVAELERLEGQRVAITDQGYEIEDIAGEGKPLVGVVERRGRDLYLVARDGQSYRLQGVLARPRMAGPGYKVWVLGKVSGQAPGLVIDARRLGVLAPPHPG